MEKACRNLIVSISWRKREKKRRRLSEVTEHHVHRSWYSCRLNSDVWIAQLDRKRVPQARSSGCKSSSVVVTAECSRQHASRNVSWPQRAPSAVWHEAAIICQVERRLAPLNYLLTLFCYCYYSPVISCIVTRTVTYGPRSFAVSGPTVWKTLPSTLRVSTTTLGQFQSGLKTILFRLAYGTWFGALVTV